MHQRTVTETMVPVVVREGRVQDRGCLGCKKYFK